MPLPREAAVTCVLVWYEYLMGPLATDEAELAHAFLRGRIELVTEEDAVLAAELFNATGRRRTLKTDALIAAMAIRAEADFVTVNVTDFEPFVAHGLRLVPGEAWRSVHPVPQIKRAAHNEPPVAGEKEEAPGTQAVVRSRPALY
jgi:predicted nucleic acid-binding protein